MLPSVSRTTDALPGRSALPRPRASVHTRSACPSRAAREGAPGPATPHSGHGRTQLADTPGLSVRPRGRATIDSGRRVCAACVRHAGRCCASRPGGPCATSSGTSGARPGPGPEREAAQPVIRVLADREATAERAGTSRPKACRPISLYIHICMQVCMYANERDQRGRMRCGKGQQDRPRARARKLRDAACLRLGQCLILSLPLHTPSLPCGRLLSA